MLQVPEGKGGVERGKGKGKGKNKKGVVLKKAGCASWMHVWPVIPSTTVQRMVQNVKKKDTGTNEKKREPCGLGLTKK